MSHSDTIDTTSKLFKLYANRCIRVQPFVHDIESVIEKNYKSIDICNYGRNILAELFYQFMCILIKIAIGVVVGMAIIVPVMTLLLWAITDNGFIIFFGDAVGGAILIIDFLILAVVAIVFGLAGLSESKIIKRTFKTARTMSASTTLAQWAKAKHGQYCVKLKFDRHAVGYGTHDDDMTATERKRQDAGMEWPTDEEWDRE